MPRVIGHSLEELDELSEEFELKIVDALEFTLSRALPALSIEPLASSLTAAAGDNLDDLSNISYVWNEQVDDLSLIIGGVYEGGALSVGFDVVDELDLVPGEGIPALTDEFAVTYLQGASNRLKGVGELLWQNVRSELLQGYQAGEGVDQLALRVQTALGSTLGRAKTIARTEIVAASNAGSLAQLQFVGLDAKKEWISTHDTRTRESHLFANGQTVALNSTFTVGGSSLRFPGDPGGAAGEVINCRCTLAYEFPEDAQPEYTCLATSDTILTAGVVSAPGGCLCPQPGVVAHDVTDVDIPPELGKYIYELFKMKPISPAYGGSAIFKRLEFVKAKLAGNYPGTEFASLTDFQLLKIIDALYATEKKKPNDHGFEKKFNEWIESPAGAKATGGLKKPTEASAPTVTPISTPTPSVTPTTTISISDSDISMSGIVKVWGTGETKYGDVIAEGTTSSGAKFRAINDGTQVKVEYYDPIDDIWGFEAAGKTAVEIIKKLPPGINWKKVSKPDLIEPQYATPDDVFKHAMAATFEDVDDNVVVVAISYNAKGDKIRLVQTYSGTLHVQYVNTKGIWSNYATGKISSGSDLSKLFPSANWTLTDKNSNPLSSLDIPKSTADTKPTVPEPPPEPTSTPPVVKPIQTPEQLAQTPTVQPTAGPVQPSPAETKAFYDAFLSHGKVTPAYPGSKIYKQLAQAKASIQPGSPLASMSDKDLLSLLDTQHISIHGKKGSATFADKVAEWADSSAGKKTLPGGSSDLGAKPAGVVNEAAPAANPTYAPLEPNAPTPPDPVKKVAKKTAAKAVKPDQKLIDEGGDISGFTDADMTQVFTTFKDKTKGVAGLYLTDKPAVIFDRIQQVREHLKQQGGSFANLTDLQVIRILDAQGAKNVGKPNAHLFEQKIVDWLKTPTGAKYAKTKAESPIPKYGSNAYTPPVAKKTAKKASPAYEAPTSQHADLPQKTVPAFTDSTQGKTVPTVPTDPKAYQVLTESAAAQMQQEMVGEEKWSAAQRASLRYYTSNAYTVMNAYLRGLGNASSTVVKHIIEAQKGMRRSTRNIILHRGTGLQQFGLPESATLADLKKLVGEDFIDYGFMSTSFGGNAAFGGKVLLEFEAPAGTPMAYVKEISHFKSENEILLAAGTRYKVIGVEEMGSGYSKKFKVRVRVIP